jgi:hypothetical protein
MVDNKARGGNGNPDMATSEYGAVEARQLPPSILGSVGWMRLLEVYSCT